MFMIKCRCGKNSQNFKHNIGAFYVEECCLEAGFDEMGKPTSKEIEVPTGLTQELIETEASNLKPDQSPEPEDPPSEEEKAKLKAESKAKKDAEKAEKAKLKAEKDAAKAKAKAEKEAQKSS